MHIMNKGACVFEFEFQLWTNTMKPYPYMTNNNGINAFPPHIFAPFRVQFKFLANLDPSKRTETIVMLMK